MLSAEANARLSTWLNWNIEESLKSDIQSLISNQQWKELEDAFYTELEFGTGGLRGIMGAGSNRMNKYTVGMATQGLANYILSVDGPRKVALAHDSRNNSDVFARIVAGIFAANGIEVYLFSALRPTPELSFTIRQLGCISGVVLTASHNPREYNGYKAYWNDGSQVVAPHDKNIIAEVRKISNPDQVKWSGNEDLIHLIDEEIDRPYLNYLKSLSINPSVILRNADLPMVYSPLHGTGITMVPQILKALGFSNVTIVEEQATPDGNFPTVVYPNPEEQEAMTLALNKADEVGAELVLATDPDSDRVGIAIRNRAGKMELLNGNQTNCLLLWYILEAKKQSSDLNPSDFVVKTIVSSEMMKAIADAYNVECFDTLTGFKYIASIIRNLEGERRYLCGGEESYGFLIGDQVRDKDAVGAVAMIAELAAWAKENFGGMQGMLEAMYAKFGLYREKLVSLTRKGKEGVGEIQAMMERFRNQPPIALAGSAVAVMKDYKTGISKQLNTGIETTIDIERSNVLQFITENGCIVSCRPSGTEPKIKFYLGVRAELNGDFQSTWEAAGALADQLVQDLGV